MSLVKNSILNLSGYIIPTLVAIPALGYLARALGTERFGILTLAMAIVGYASIFDAGLTRAVIREISIHRGEDEEKYKIISSSSISVGFFGFLGFLLINLFSSQIVVLLNVSHSLFSEVNKSLSILALSIPMFLLNQIWLAILEGEERFVNINLQRCVSGSLIAGFPALFVFILKGDILIDAMYGLVFGRFTSLIMAFYSNKLEIYKAGCSFHQKTFLRLFGFGGWITVSNIISPIMNYFDRFIVSHLLGANSVAFYTAPSEAVTKLSIIPSALSRAIFPKLSGFSLAYEKNKQKKYGYILLGVSYFPIIFITFLFADKILVTWMGKAYAGLPVDILRVLLIGLFFNSLAQIPFSSIQAAGRAKITACLHMFELIPYLIALYFLVDNFSLLGVAIAWTLRTSVDFIILFFIDKKIN